LNSASSPAAQEGGMLPLRVAGKTCIAPDVFLFELVHRDGAPLPAFTAGAHVTVLTPNGLTRRYSLCNSPAQTDRYCIAVKREPQGQGGSASMIDQVQAGDDLPASAPQNYFSLDAQAASHLLIAGGIGITPILAMAHELQARGADFKLIYLTRSAEATAFLDDLRAAELAPRVLIHHDQGDVAQALDLSPWLARPHEGTHLYCCGPRGLMQAVREQARDWPSGSVHFEDFGTGEPQQQTGEDRPFTVKLARSGRTIAVPSGVSILEALRREDIAVPSSCESGTCGTCRTGLIAGVAEHRDYVLDEDEQDTQIMICVSRAVSPQLELDL
jgi:phthalate 4,5-dioxygenase reductase component